MTPNIIPSLALALGALLTPALTAQTTNPADLDLVPESSGNTFSATWNGQPVFVGLVGFNRVIAGDSITGEFLDSTVTPNNASRLVGTFNGREIREFDGAPQLAFAPETGLPGRLNSFSTLNDLDSATFLANGRIFQGAVLVFSGGGAFSLNQPRGGVETWSGNGNLGDLGEIGGQRNPNDLNIVAESSGNTYSATLNGQPVFVGFAGFANVRDGDSVDAAFLASLEVPGNNRLQTILNGEEVRDFDGVTQLAFSAGLGVAAPFTVATLWDDLAIARFETDGRIFRGLAIVFSGSSPFTLRSPSGGTDTWVGNGVRGDLGELTDVPAIVTAGRSGCAIPGVVSPSLVARTSPVVGQDFVLDIVDAPLNTTMVSYQIGAPLVTPINLGVILIPDCNLLVDSFFSFPAPFPNSEIRIPIENSATLLGVRGLAIQGLVFAPGVTLFDAIVTDELIFSVGNVPAVPTTTTINP